MTNRSRGFGVTPSATDADRAQAFERLAGLRDENCVRQSARPSRDALACVRPRAVPPHKRSLTRPTRPHSDTSGYDVNAAPTPAYRVSGDRHGAIQGWSIQAWGVAEGDGPVGSRADAAARQGGLWTSHKRRPADEPTRSPRRSTPGYVRRRGDDRVRSSPVLVWVARWRLPAELNAQGQQLEVAR